MRIGELSRATGASPRSLRYYEEQGLLGTQRTGTGHRRYGADAPTVVGHIRAMLAAGLPTAVIRQVLPCVEGPGPQVNSCVSDLLRDRLHDIETQIGTLETAHTALAGLLASTAPAVR
ncbi:MerR family transcriptional regulator [Nocardia aurantia]|uniref:Nodulation protein NolA n=1 Tax=Nocardia aurantia TaxID=2585199 RepID=A0A7K0DQG0_9NOCA|nr:MerR family transcriptional regulator [Nocardia aurantia]MQY28016.1 Nodulation protein NolA [Nocardia aurantia]